MAGEVLVRPGGKKCLKGAFGFARSRCFFRFSKVMDRFSIASQPVMSARFTDLQSRTR